MNMNENATFLQSSDEQQNPPTAETLSSTTTYYYAVLDDNDIVTEVISSPFPAPESYTQYIQIDSLDESLVGKLYDRETGTFVAVPALTCDTENVSYNGTTMRLNTKLNIMDAAISENAAAKHTHDNKTVLDGITADKVSAWDNGTGATVDAYTKTESDAKYATIGASYTKAESDEKYALAGSGGATMTASEILTAIKTVDGTESGLDADTLDGKHASEFAFSNHSHTEYAAATHTHDGYAASDHTHTGYAASSHTHAQSDITGLEDSLSGKASIDHTHTGYAAAEHTHTGYAAAEHTHTGYAASGHTHGQSDITGLETALNGKADADHTHTGYAASSHTHAQSDITGLEDALNGKASSSHTHTEYAASNHTHSEYAATDHSHTGYATSDHSHELPGLSGTLPISKGGTGATTAAAALSALGAAASGHSHSEYAASNHTHSGYAASNHTHSGYASSDHTHSQYSLSGHSHTTNGSCEFTGNIRTRDVFSAADGTYNLGAYSNRYKFVYSSNQLQVPSDARMKEEVLNTSRAELMDFLKNLHVITYKYKNDKEKKKRIGLIAQEMQNASPRLAEYFLNEDEETGMLSLSAADLVFPLIAAVQMLSEQVETLLLNK